MVRLIRLQNRIAAYISKNFLNNIFRTILNRYTFRITKTSYILLSIVFRTDKMILLLCLVVPEWCKLL